jgi:hypothetical protein
LTGAPVSSLTRAILPGADDIFIGDPITIASGAATQMAVEGVCAGVCVGIGTVDGEGNVFAYDPANLEKSFFDTSADTEADYRILYVPAEDVIFEAQSDGTTDLVVGEAQDILATDGDQTSGRSKMEINDDALTNDGDVTVVEIPTGPKYDNTASTANRRYWVKFNNTLFNNV